MRKRITGMQDPGLRYPAPDPLREIMRPSQATTEIIVSDIMITREVNKEQSGQTPLELGKTAVEPADFLPRRRTIPMSYDEQIKILEGRRLFIAF